MQTNYKIIHAFISSNILSEMSEKRGILVENKVFSNLNVDGMLKFSYATNNYQIITSDYPNIANIYFTKQEALT